MESTTSILALALGLLARIGIPFLVTILVVGWLRNLDARWQEQAGKEMAPYPVSRPGNSGCWKVKNCSPEKRASCKACAHRDQPCWQVFREPDGRLRESCLGCEVFSNAPMPVPAGD